MERDELWSSHGWREVAVLGRYAENGIYGIGRKCVLANAFTGFFKCDLRHRYIYTKLTELYNSHSNT